MTFLSKAAAAFAALSMVTAPVAASAASAKFEDLRANSTMDQRMAQNDLGGLSAEEIFLLLAAIAAIIAGVVIAADGTNDNPTSPN